MISIGWPSACSAAARNDAASFIWRRVLVVPSCVVLAIAPARGGTQTAAGIESAAEAHHLLQPIDDVQRSAGDLGDDQVKAVRSEIDGCNGTQGAPQRGRDRTCLHLDSPSPRFVATGLRPVKRLIGRNHALLSIA
jgi:hypothetical protein